MPAKDMSYTNDGSLFYFSDFIHVPKISSSNDQMSKES